MTSWEFWALFFYLNSEVYISVLNAFEKNEKKANILEKGFSMCNERSFICLFLRIYPLDVDFLFCEV